MRSWYQGLMEDPGLEVFEGLNMTELRRDEAYVVGNSSFDVVGLYSVEDDCPKCPYKLIKTLQKDREVSWIVNSSLRYTWRFLNSADEEFRAYNNRSGLICELRPNVGEFGVYRMKIGSCVLQPELEPVDIYIPLILTAVILMVLGTVYSLFVTVRTKFFQEKQSNVQKQHVAAKRDTQALDIFLGLATLLWLFFISGAGGYHFFSRPWHGILVEDVMLSAIFWGIGFGLPNFIHKSFFISNNKFFVLWCIIKYSLPLALLDAGLQSMSRQAFEVSVLWRPLEKITIAYLIAGVVYAVTFQKPRSRFQGSVKKICTDVKGIGGCLLIICLLYAAYMVLNVKLVFYNNDLNFNSTFENSSESTKQVLYYIKIISGHDKHVGSVDSYYLFKDGLLGLISTAVYLLFGVQAGSIAVHHKDHYSRMKRWAFWALNQTLLTVFLAILSWNINLNLLSICFTLISSAGFQLVFYVLYVATDIWNLRHDVPFYVVGKNALLVILGQTLCGDTTPLWWDIPLRTHFIFLLQNLWIMFFWILVCVYVTKKNFKINL